MDDEDTIKERERDEKHGTPCNPSLPVDLEVDETRLRGDAIGNTLYSESWVIKILMKLVKHRDEEWTDDLETELCLLWDMTVDEDVVNLLMEHRFLKHSSQVIKTTTIPRLTEMMVGIVGNMSCVSQVQADISRDSDMIVLLLELLSVPDAPMLVQLTRLIQTCTWSLRSPPEEHESFWLQHLCDDSKWIASVTFILSSSTNKELLMSMLALLETLCSHELVATHIASPDMVTGVVEAMKQLHRGYDDDDSNLEKAACHSAEILSCFTSFSSGRQALGDKAQKLSDVLHAYLATLSRDTVTQQQMAFISAAVSVVGTILNLNGFFSPCIFTCLLAFHVRFQEVGAEEHADMLNNLKQYFRLVMQATDKHLVATVLEDCSAAEVTLLQGMMTDEAILT